MLRVNLKGKPSDYGRHPWIFRQRIKSVEGRGRWAKVFVKGKFLGSGLYSPVGNIAVRMYSRQDQAFNMDFVKSKIREAKAFRESVLGFKGAYRLLFAESDDVPGLVADLYGGGVVIQVSCRPLEELKEEVISAFEAEGFEYLFEKSDSHLRRLEGLEPFVGWHFGKRDSEVVDIEGVKFIVNFSGQKTGLYLDQRVNWYEVSRLMGGAKRVLDAFCYTGGFTLFLLREGVEQVVAVDEDEEALEILKENLKLNSMKGVMTLRGNAFDLLDSFLLSHDEFDGVVLDPPAFAKGKDLKGALRGYTLLVDRSLRILRRGGILALFSCSRHVGYRELEDVLSRVSKNLMRKVRVIKRLWQSPDHPVPVYFKEAEYLKGLVCYVD